MALFYLLLLSFFESNVLSEFLAVLFELDFSLYLLLVLSSPVHLSGLLVFDDDEFVLLSHMRLFKTFQKNSMNSENGQVERSVAYLIGKSLYSGSSPLPYISRE